MSRVLFFVLHPASLCSAIIRDFLAPCLIAQAVGKEVFMRSCFIECKSRKTAWRRCPWAAVIVKVEGGFHAFESYSDYAIWKAQK